MAELQSFNMLSTAMTEHLMSALQTMRREKEMCDIAIISQNNVKHDAHSIILAAASPVFKVMVTREFKEFHSKTITIPDIDKEMMECILEFIYSGVIELTNDNVLDLFSVADRLEISTLVSECKRYIIHQLDVSNCLGVRRLGERYCHDDILQSSTTYILQMFEKFSETQDFLELSFLEIVEFLSHDELNVEKEENLFDITFRWIDHDKKRKTHLKDLLKCLRYPVMNLKIIQKKFKTQPLLKTKSIQQLGKVILNGCHKFEKRQESCIKNSLEWFTVEHRIPPHIIFLVGGWNRGRTLDVCECYNRKSNEWYVTEHLRDAAGGRCYFGMDIVRNSVYIVGGYDGKNYLNTVRKFDPMTRKWCDVANMLIRRCFNAVVSYNNELYAIAGFDGSRRLTSVERYIQELNQWTLIKPLNTPRSDSSAVSHRGRIYVCGGYGGDSLCSCEVYDKETDYWQYIAQMGCKRSGASVISVPNENKILVLGGYNGTSRVKTIEYYDPDEDTWTYGPSMINSRSNFATCVIGKSLYVVGGYTGHSTIADVEVYDLVERTWTATSSLNVSRSAMRAVLLGNLPNTKDYFDGGIQQLDKAKNNSDFWARRFHGARTRQA